MLKKSFTKVAVLMLVVVFVLSACSPSNDTENKNNESSSAKIEKTTAETTSEKVDKEEDKADSSKKTAKDEDDKTDEDKKGDDKKDDSKKSGEEGSQQSSDKLPDIEYSYQAIIDNSGGLIRIPDDVEGPKAADNYQKQVEAELKTIDFKALSENASDSEIEDLFKHILKVASYDYSPIDEVQRFPYLIFKEDKIDPWTNKKVEEDLKINVEIVLDASGSMANKINGEEMMTIAKNSIAEVLAKMPENANVGLRVFGHRGDNSDASMEISCNANELIHPIKPLDVDGINNSLTAIKPTGWTSIAKSIENGVNDFKEFNDEKTLNILYIITDGVET